MQLTITTQDQQITLSTPLNTNHIEVTPKLKVTLQRICNDYQDSLEISDYQKSKEALLVIGEQLFQVINIYQPLMQEWLNDGGSRQLEILANASPDNLQSLLLNLPWEIMATTNDFFAAGDNLYEVSRRIGKANNNPPEAKYKDLTLTFMAADPDMDSGLQYEQEERAILQATRTSNNLNLIVEESGNLQSLTQRIIDLGHCDIAHLSCHGGIDSQRGFVLQLEDEYFGLQEVTANDFQLLSQHISCLFVSACHSGHSDDSLEKQALTARLASVGIANVIGWDGSVKDSDASYFASQFYQALLTATTVTTAFAFAQKESLRNNKQHWHLGRCYLSSNGGGKLIATNKPKNPNRRGKNFHIMLDKVKKQVRVASKESFVGRRWQTKQALQSFSEGRKAGVLLYGIGGTGKSSLAARIIDRLEPQYKPVIIYKHYEAFDILTALQRASHSSNKSQDFAKWINQAKQEPKQFTNILIELLEEHFSDTPIILFLDDLEQHILETLQQGQEKVAVKVAFQQTLLAIIEAFDVADTESSLLLTSRYIFTLPNESGEDIADNLQSINVPDMNAIEQLKHWIALLQTIDSKQTQRDIEQDNCFLDRIFTICQGNPGLQDVLFTPLLKGEIDALKMALEKIENYQADSDQQTTAEEQKDIDKYLQRVALQAYSAALSDSEHQLLRIMTLFSFPIPQELIIQAAPKLGLEQPKKMLQRLDNFGLLNHWQGKGLEQHISCFSLARMVVDPLSRKDRHFIAMVCAPLLWQIWFKDFLTLHKIKPTKTLKEGIELITNGPFPSGY